MPQVSVRGGEREGGREGGGRGKEGEGRREREGGREGGGRDEEDRERVSERERESMLSCFSLRPTCTCSLQAPSSVHIHVHQLPILQCASYNHIHTNYREDTL